MNDPIQRAIDTIAADLAEDIARSNLFDELVEELQTCHDTFDLMSAKVTALRIENLLIRARALQK